MSEQEGGEKVSQEQSNLQIQRASKDGIAQDHQAVLTREKRIEIAEALGARGIFFGIYPMEGG
jgi:hypothetical protein